MVELRTGWTHGRDSQKRSGKREDRDHLDPLHSDLRKTKDYICRTHKHQQRCQWNIQGQDQARPTSGDISYTCQKSSTRSQDPFPRRPWGCGSLSSTHSSTILEKSREKKEEIWNTRKLFPETLDWPWIILNHGIRPRFILDWAKSVPIPQRN